MNNSQRFSKRSPENRRMSLGVLVFSSPSPLAHSLPSHGQVAGLTPRLHALHEPCPSALRRRFNGAHPSGWGGGLWPLPSYLPHGGSSRPLGRPLPKTGWLALPAALVLRSRSMGLAPRAWSPRRVGRPALLGPPSVPGRLAGPRRCLDQLLALLFHSSPVLQPLTHLSTSSSLPLTVGRAPWAWTPRLTLVLSTPLPP